MKEYESVSILGLPLEFPMNIIKDGFQVRKIAKEEISGAIAPIYLMGLPGDLDKLELELRFTSSLGEQSV